MCDIAKISQAQAPTLLAECLLLPGVQKFGTAGTADTGRTTFGWTQLYLDEEKN